MFPIIIFCIDDIVSLRYRIKMKFIQNSYFRARDLRTVGPDSDRAMHFDLFLQFGSTINNLVFSEFLLALGRDKTGDLQGVFENLS